MSFKAFPLGLLRKIRDGDIEQDKARNNQREFKSNLDEIVNGKEECKTEKRKSAIKHIIIF